MQHLIAPSILSADFLNLGNDIEMVNNSIADWIHVDIMDGLFVPNITFGIPILSQIKKIAKKPLDVHLMIHAPDRYLEQFKNAGAEILHIHYEANNHIHRSIQSIHKLGIKAGIVINPHTNVFLLADIVSDVDVICIMSVNPGFGGQQFIENTYKKIIQLKEMLLKHNSKALIEIDGGVDSGNAKKLIETGADVLVAGNFVFKSPNPAKTIQQLKTLTF